MESSIRPSFTRKNRPLRKGLLTTSHEYPRPCQGEQVVPSTLIHNSTGSHDRWSTLSPDAYRLHLPAMGVARYSRMLYASLGKTMTQHLTEYADASPEVRAVYDDIMQTRKVDQVNNFWKCLAAHPPTLRRTWESLKEIMAPGALDPLTKELLYVAVSVTNNCPYCIASHTAAARKAGMTDEMFGELQAVVGMANETNRLATGYRVPVDDMFKWP